MVDNHISSIIITEGEKLAGIITEYDVVAEMVEETNRCVACNVGETMTTPVITINEDINLFEANKLMIINNVRRLPVTEGEKLIGIVTQTDMCRSIFKFLKVSLEHAEKGELQWEKLEKRTIEKRLV